MRFHCTVTGLGSSDDVVISVVMSCGCDVPTASDGNAVLSHVGCAADVSYGVCFDSCTG